MANQSKEDALLHLILGNSPLRHWHFAEFVEQSGMTRAAVNNWLKKFQKQGILKRFKEKGSFPYFTAGKDNLAYQSKKRLYMLEKLYNSGLVSHLMSLPQAKVIIVFGSVSKGDWYMDSDIDIFIYGSPDGFDKESFEKKLGRNIELHVFESRKDLQEVKTGLLKNVVNGYLIKGQLQEFAEVS